MKQLRKSTLKKMISKGLLVAKCERKYTDDYQLDAATCFGKTEWLPCMLNDVPDTTSRINFFDVHFEYKSGYAYEKEDSTIFFQVKTDEVYTLKKA